MDASTLHEKFSTGKKPTGEDFKQLIDFRGKDGAPGKDGFGTEVQYKDLVSRIEALEAK